MTPEEAQELIDRGNKTGNFALVEQGLSAIKEAQKKEQQKNCVTEIKRTKKQGDKKYCTRRPIDKKKINAFNMFSDDGLEHAEDKLLPEEKGKWKTTDHNREPVQLQSVECGSCGNEYLLHPSLVKKIELNPDGTEHNGNICDSCIVKKKGSR